MRGSGTREGSRARAERRWTAIIKGQTTSLVKAPPGQAKKAARQLWKTYSNGLFAPRRTARIVVRSQHRANAVDAVSDKFSRELAVGFFKKRKQKQ